MSGDSVPWALPLARFSTNDREATTLFRELRKPLLRYLVCLGLSSDEAQDVVQDAFLSLHRHLLAGRAPENIAHNAAGRDGLPADASGPRAGRSNENIAHNAAGRDGLPADASASRAVRSNENIRSWLFRV